MPDAAQHPAQPELPSPYHPGKRRGRTRRTHTVAKVLLATLLTLGMVSGLSVAFLYRHLNGNINHVLVDDQLYNRPDKVHVDAPKQPMNILVMGLASEKPVRVDDTAFIQTSFPGFVDMMRRMGGDLG